jgi:hypothetical protein
LAIEPSTEPQDGFDDLFGTRLAHWQTELDRRQSGSERDTRTEVEKIRDIGLDFFGE